MLRTEYREEPCRSALNRVKGMPFGWSLNPYMGCAHQCTFCYVRAFERRADRPSDDRYGSSVRVKVNVADVLRRELARKSWLLADVVRAARDHGATHVWANVLYLRPGTREHFLDKLAAIWPELLPMYQKLYAGRAYLPEAVVRPRRAAVAALARELGVADRRQVKLVPVAPPSPAEQLEWILSADAGQRHAA